MATQKTARGSFTVATLLSSTTPSTYHSGLTLLIRPISRRQHTPCYGKTSFSSSCAARTPLPPPDKASRKHPPSPSSTSSSISSSTSTSTPSDVSSTVNPPPSTRPAKLELPEKPANSSKSFSYYFSLGKAYYAFYKTGLKNVYHNYRTAAPIRKKLGFAGYLPTLLPPRALSGTSAFEQLVTREGVTRAEFQLLRRSAHDVRRMIPFVLILIVCGEFTPLVVLALGARVTPLTCRVPRQLEKERRLKLERKSAALRAATTTAAAAGGSSQEWLNLTTLPRSVASVVRHASADEILRSCAVLGLSKSHRLPGYIPGFMQGTVVNWVYRPKLRRWLEYLAVDDALMREGGGVRGLSADELRIAVEERGGVDVGIDKAREEERERMMRRWLGTWIGEGGT
ncbi:hypothetical protein PRK78_005895 [Emydomyces testavorans]|uniref:Letm1 RBD domain-containing protein n=1 Tax=Emydomyces testavorans TaxID=2070801 RepID=A0AAF0DPA5_9EURO|nr:hypothetical protein PRK78_005895 [Emydomyces testavorans]